jgi:hypothetical protein
MQQQSRDDNYYNYNGGPTADIGGRADDNDISGAPGNFASWGNFRIDGSLC